MEGFLSYDAVYRRQRFVWRQFSNGEVEEYDRLFLEKQKILYEFNIQKKQCTKTEGFNWIDYSVPKDSKFVQSVYIGAAAVPGANILTNVWTYNTTDTQGNNISVIGRWTDVGCIPVSVEGLDFSTPHSSFFDITPGISGKAYFLTFMIFYIIVELI